MKIIGWDKYNPEKYEAIDDNDRHEAKNLIINELRKNNYHFNGFYHQQGEKGCPIFDNGKQYRTTLRAWGAIMAAAFPNEKYDCIWDYCTWAWNNADETLVKYPE